MIESHLKIFTAEVEMMLEIEGMEKIKIKQIINMIFIYSPNTFIIIIIIIYSI